MNSARDSRPGLPPVDGPQSKSSGSLVVLDTDSFFKDELVTKPKEPSARKSLVRPPSSSFKGASSPLDAAGHAGGPAGAPSTGTASPDGPRTADGAPWGEWYDSAKEKAAHRGSRGGQGQGSEDPNDWKVSSIFNLVEKVTLRAASRIDNMMETTLEFLGSLADPEFEIPRGPNEDRARQDERRRRREAASAAAARGPGGAAGAAGTDTGAAQGTPSQAGVAPGAAASFASPGAASNASPATPSDAQDSAAAASSTPEGSLRHAVRRALERDAIKGLAERASASAAAAKSAVKPNPGPMAGPVLIPAFKDFAVESPVKAAKGGSGGVEAELAMVQEELKQKTERVNALEAQVLRLQEDLSKMTRRAKVLHKENLKLKADLQHRPAPDDSASSTPIPKQGGNRGEDGNGNGEEADADGRGGAAGAAAGRGAMADSPAEVHSYPRGGGSGSRKDLIVSEGGSEDMASPSQTQPPPAEDEFDVMRLQVECLLGEKSSLMGENARLQRENQQLSELLMYAVLDAQAAMSDSPTGGAPPMGALQMGHVHSMPIMGAHMAAAEAGQAH